MSCLNPTSAWQDLASFTKSGKNPVIFSLNDLDPNDYSWRYDDEKRELVFESNRYITLDIPCGKCILCRQARAWDLSVRAFLELRTTPGKVASFITLTVDDEVLDEVFPGGVLIHRPWQLFAKRLRKRIGSFRYLMCGEYGEKSHRPHYHAVIFGHDLYDRKFFIDGKYGEKLAYCDSPLLRDCWLKGHGNVMCRPVNENAIAYVAGYVVKDIIGEHDVRFWYNYSDLESKGLRPFKESYTRWSRNPGLGFEYLKRFPDTFSDSNYFFMDGHYVATLSPSIITSSGKECYFGGRYYKKILQRCSNRDLGQLKINEPTRLRLAEKYDILQARNQGRVLAERLHDLPYATNVENLQNRAALQKHKLARKRRDVV